MFLRNFRLCSWRRRPSDEKFRKVDNYGAARGMQWRHPRLVAAQEPSSDPSGKI